MRLIKDPHAMISSGTTWLAEIVGEGVRFSRELAYIAVIIAGLALAVYEFKKCIREDKEYGSRRRIVRKVVEIMITMLGLDGGSYIASLIGWITGIDFSTFGWVMGGLFAGRVCDRVLDPILDYFKIDIYSVDCENCGEKFECRRYEVGDQKECEKCSNKKID